MIFSSSRATGYTLKPNLREDGDGFVDLNEIFPESTILMMADGWWLMADE